MNFLAHGVHLTRLSLGDPRFRLDVIADLYRSVFD